MNDWVSYCSSPSPQGLFSRLLYVTFRRNLFNREWESCFSNGIHRHCHLMKISLFCRQIHFVSLGHTLVVNESIKFVDIFMAICKNINMRTTLDLPDELVTEIKILAAQERSSLKELIGDLLRNGLKARTVTARQNPLPPIYRSRASIGRNWISEIRRDIR